MNTLLEDILEDQIADALAAPAGARPKERVLVTKWTSGGYLARVTWKFCACGASLEALDGLFHEEIGSNGTRRLTRLDDRAQFPLSQTHRVEVTELRVPHCAQCIGAMGFTQTIPAPKDLTMEVGVGLLGVKHG